MIRAFAMLLLLIAITAAMCAIAWCEQIHVAWDQPPTGPVITQWKLYRIHPLPRVQIGVTETNHAWVDVSTGDHIVVTACTVTEESADSAPWYVRLPYPDPVARVTIETSTDLITWESYQAFDLPESKARFFRLKIDPAK